MRIDEAILIKLDTLETNLAELSEKVVLCRIDIAGLKVKSGIWGALAGLVPVVLGLGVWVISLQ